MRRSNVSSPDVSDANLRPSQILDYLSERVQTVVGQLKPLDTAPQDYLHASYRLLREQVRPIYTVDELQPASWTLAKGKGSCSQSFACLESIARAVGIATRVRGLWIAGSFWNRRFGLAKAFIPSRILLAWPHFYVDGDWVSVEELFESPQILAEQNPRGFANDSESLFDAIDHIAIDFDGKTAACGTGACDLSGYVVGDAGLFDLRDELFAATPSFQHTLRGRAFERIYGGRKSGGSIA
jgi:hypothetical protein